MTVPRFWRKVDQRYRMKGTECKNCNTAYFPPRELCPECRREGEVVERDFSGEGEIVSYTVVHDPGENYEGAVPYTLAVIELDEGPRLTAQIPASKDEVEIGKRVESQFRKIGQEGEQGILHYGTKFVPVEE